MDTKLKHWNNFRNWKSKALELHVNQTIIAKTSPKSVLVYMLIRRCLRRCLPPEWAGTDPDAPSLDSSGRSYSTSVAPSSTVWRPSSCPLSPTQSPPAVKNKSSLEFSYISKQCSVDLLICRGQFLIDCQTSQKAIPVIFYPMMYADIVCISTYFIISGLYNVENHYHTQNFT